MTLAPFSLQILRVDSEAFGHISFIFPTAFFFLTVLLSSTNLNGIGRHFQAAPGPPDNFIGGSSGIHQHSSQVSFFFAACANYYSAVGRGFRCLPTWQG